VVQLALLVMSPLSPLEHMSHVGLFESSKLRKQYTFLIVHFSVNHTARALHFLFAPQALDTREAQNILRNLLQRQFKQPCCRKQMAKASEPVAKTTQNIVLRTLPYAVGAASGAAVSAGVDLAAAATGAAAGVATGITSAILRETTRVIAGDIAATAVSSALNTGVFVAGTAAHTTARVAGAAAGAVTAMTITGVGNAMVRVAMGPDGKKTLDYPLSARGPPQDGQGERWGAASAMWDEVAPPNHPAPAAEENQEQPGGSVEEECASPISTCSTAGQEGGCRQRQSGAAQPREAPACSSQASPQHGHPQRLYPTVSVIGESHTNRLREIEGGFVWVPSPPAHAASSAHSKGGK